MAGGGAGSVPVWLANTRVELGKTAGKLYTQITSFRTGLNNHISLNLHPGSLEALLKIDWM